MEQEDILTGYALSSPSPGTWSYRAVTSDMPLEIGEVFYSSKDDFPQEAKDWLAENTV
ncbi:MAG: hypothetical protein WBW32_15390 [Luteibacter sp.]